MDPRYVLAMLVGMNGGGPLMEPAKKDDDCPEENRVSRAWEVRQVNVAALTANATPSDPYLPQVRLTAVTE
jgi:hypothetical protein